MSRTNMYQFHVCCIHSVEIACRSRKPSSRSFSRSASTVKVNLLLPPGSSSPPLRPNSDSQTSQTRKGETSLKLCKRPFRASGKRLSLNRKFPNRIAQDQPRRRNLAVSPFSRCDEVGASSMATLLTRLSLLSSDKKPDAVPTRKKPIKYPAEGKSNHIS